MRQPFVTNVHCDGRRSDNRIPIGDLLLRGRGRGAGPPADLGLLWRTRFRWKLRPRQVIEATKFGNDENIAAVEREGDCAKVPLSDGWPLERTVPRYGVKL